MILADTRKIKEKNMNRIFEKAWHSFLDDMNTELPRDISQSWIKEMCRDITGRELRIHIESKE